MGEEETYDDFSPEGEVAFWAWQFAEHAQLEMAALNHRDKSNSRLLETGRGLRRVFELIYGEPATDRATVEDAMAALRAHEEDLLAQGKLRYIGPLFPSIVEHHLVELEHLERVLSASRRDDPDWISDVPPSRGDLLRFYADMNADHAEIARHLIDPAEYASLEEADRLRDIMEGIEDAAASPRRNFEATLAAARQPFAEISDFYAEIVQGVEERKLDSIISPLLAHHLRREGLRAVAALDAF